jgi:hypothetical protein
MKFTFAFGALFSSSSSSLVRHLSFLAFFPVSFLHPNNNWHEKARHVYEAPTRDIVNII